MHSQSQAFVKRCTAMALGEAEVELAPSQVDSDGWSPLWTLAFHREIGPLSEEFTGMRNTLRVSETFLFPFALGVVRRCGRQASAHDVGESQVRGVFSLCRSGSGGPGSCQTAHAVHSYFV